MKRFDRDLGIRKLETALTELMSVDELKALAALTGQRLPARKADLAALIQRHLAGEGLRAVWEGLDELQKAAVAEVVHARSDQFPAERFRAKYGRDPDWGSSEWYGYRKHPSALDFFFYGDVMPADLKARLKAFVPPPAGVKLATLGELPTGEARTYQQWKPKERTYDTKTKQVPLVQCETERPAQRELLAVLRLVDSGKVAVSAATHRPSAAAMAEIAAVLEGGDFYPDVPADGKRDDDSPGPIRAFAWPLLLQAGGLAQAAGTRLQLTRAGRKALTAPLPETLRTLWTKWLGTTLLDELARVDAVKGQTGKGRHGLTAVAGRRHTVASALAECPVGAWVAIDELVRFMRATDRDVMVSNNPWNLYIGHPEYGSLGYAGFATVVDLRYVLALLLEYAATLGLIDVALVPPAQARGDRGELWGTDDLLFLSRYDGLRFLRLTPLGAFCLGKTSAYTPAPMEARPVLRVLPNLEIAAIGAEITPADRLALDAYAVAVSDHVWRLDPAKLVAVVDAGRPVEEVREFLTARSAGAIPDTVLQLLTDIAARSELVRDRGLARLIECAEPVLAALIANDTRTRKHCLLAGERHLVVPADAEAAFRRGLRELGYVLATGQGAAAEPKRATKTGAAAKKAHPAKKPRARRSP